MSVYCELVCDICAETWPIGSVARAPRAQQEAARREAKKQGWRTLSKPYSHDGRDFSYRVRIDLCPRHEP